MTDKHFILDHESHLNQSTTVGTTVGYKDYMESVILLNLKLTKIYFLHSQFKFFPTSLRAIRMEKNSNMTC